jgi:hypothetical protein
MWINVIAIAIALALFAQVAAFFLTDRLFRALGAARRPKSGRVRP